MAPWLNLSSIHLSVIALLASPLLSLPCLLYVSSPTPIAADGADGARRWRRRSATTTNATTVSRIRILNTLWFGVRVCACVDSIRLCACVRRLDSTSNRVTRHDFVGDAWVVAYTYAWGDDDAEEQGATHRCLRPRTTSWPSWCRRWPRCALWTRSARRRSKRRH